MIIYVKLFLIHYFYYSLLSNSLYIISNYIQTITKNKYNNIEFILEFIHI